ncbi:ribonuclease HIII [Mycoplasmopsis caviae]|uniref:Ribonuclease n=1 Tax=Mycoplasmopsis caviae TaxID=55603 RepID=A0A3P8LI03_9BACT|nr:ribonuclease HIII [Mycoplasmopsis caviae]UUD35348.1 ribonuclease HIII [Mycoplasmopsis caviae]VDR41872.1 ribonuclease HII [Mycoplasmopsis caviae]
MKFLEYNFSFDLEDKKIIGVDEVGVGDYFGPLCSAAVYIPKEKIQEVIDLGVKDSKKISDNKIKSIAYKLKKIVKYAIHHLSPKGYNSLNKFYNGNSLKMFSHLSAIGSLLKNIGSVDYVFIDQYSNKASIEKYYNNLVQLDNWAKFEPVQADILLAHKAENISLEVACASIIARDYFLYYMSKMNEEYECIFPFGAGSKVKNFAREFFNKYTDKETKNNVCKKSFKMDLEDESTTLINLFDVDK